MPTIHPCAELEFLQKNYRDHFSQWSVLLDALKDWATHRTDLPAPAFSPNGKRVNYQMAGVEAYCNFTFCDHGGVLEFGYHQDAPDGKTNIFAIDHLYFDAYGNVSIALKEPTATWSIKDSSDVGVFFFSRILKAVQRALSSG